MYVYLVECQQIDWDPKPRHVVGCFSTKRKAFSLIRDISNKAYKKLGDEGLFAKISAHKGKNRGYIILDGDNWVDEWRFRVIRFKLDEVIKENGD